MSARTSRLLKVVLGIAVLVGFLIVILAVAGLLWMRGRPRGPDVVLHAPQYGSTVNVGEVVEVRAVARHSQGVSRVELWADGELIAVRTSQLPEGSTPFPLSHGWVPQTAGEHTLVVRAYDLSQESGQSTAIVDAQEGLPPEVETSYIVEEGDTVASVAESYGFSAEELTSANPGVTDPLPAGTSLTLPPPVEDEGPPPTPGPLPDLLPGEPPPDPEEMRRPGLLGWAIPVGRLALDEDVRIQVEVLSLEVSDDYDGVYCYYALGDEAMERVPADGYLDPAGGRSWAIEPWMAGDHRRILVFPEGSETLRIRGQCLGYRHTMSGGEIFDLGTLELTTREVDWDGSIRDLLIEGPDGWFRLQYSIDSWAGYGPPPPGPSMAEEEPDMRLPILIKECNRSFVGSMRVAGYTEEVNRWLTTCTLYVDPSSVDYPVSHVIFIRNGGLFRVVDFRGVRPDPMGITLVTITPALIADPIGGAIGEALGISEETSGLPPMGETYEFRVIAVREDGAPSPTSNAVSINGSDIRPPLMPGAYVKVTLYELDFGCLHGDHFGLGVETWGIGSYPLDAEGRPIVSGCDDDLDEWGGGSYGGINVNGRSVFRMHHYVHSGGHWAFGPSYPFYQPSVSFWLGQGEGLYLDMTLWDYDVTSDDEAFCDATVYHSSFELEEIRTERDSSREYRGQPFISHYGDCYLHYQVEVGN